MPDALRQELQQHGHRRMVARLHEHIAAADAEAAACHFVGGSRLRSIRARDARYLRRLLRRLTACSERRP